MIAKTFIDRASKKQIPHSLYFLSAEFFLRDCQESSRPFLCAGASKSSQKLFSYSWSFTVIAFIPTTKLRSLAVAMDAAMDVAILALQEGCRKEELPQSTARELIRFLLLKNFYPDVSEGWSPSSKLDELQHWTLLNTRVRKVVEAAVGEISHSARKRQTFLTRTRLRGGKPSHLGVTSS